MPDRILDAARAIFGARGYANTTLKSVAAAAGVAPTVIASAYRNKEALFAAAMRLPFDPAQAFPALVAQGVDGLGERLVRMWLQLMDDPEVRRDLSAMANGGVSAVSSASSSPGTGLAQARGLVDYVQQVLVDPVAALLGVPDARTRAVLVASMLGGMVGVRYLLRLEPIASASTEEIVALYAPGIQRVLDPTIPLR